MNDCESFLDILSECNCCERHKIDKPKKNTKWYCRDDPKEILTRIRKNPELPFTTAGETAF